VKERGRKCEKFLMLNSCIVYFANKSTKLLSIEINYFEIWNELLKLRFFFHKSNNGSYGLAMFLVYRDNAPATGTIDSAVNGYAAESATITDAVNSQFSEFTSQIADPTVLKENQVTAGKLIQTIFKNQKFHPFKKVNQFHFFRELPLSMVVFSF